MECRGNMRMIANLRTVLNIVETDGRIRFLRWSLQLFYFMVALFLKKFNIICYTSVLAAVASLVICCALQIGRLYVCDGVVVNLMKFLAMAFGLVAVWGLIPKWPLSKKSLRWHSQSI